MMTLVIVLMLVFSYLLIATGHFTGVNKAAIAMFLGTISWVVFVIWGDDFVQSQHAAEYAEFLGGAESTSKTVKYFIYDKIFLNYVGRQQRRGIWAEDHPDVPARHHVHHRDTQQ